jgi:hypothetical protein
MPVFEFTTFIDIVADNYDEAIDIFDFKLKHGDIDRGSVYVADIEEKE